MAVYRDFNQTNIINDIIDSDSIKASVQNIVTTERGTIPGFPEFGCKIKSMLFEQIDVFTITVMKTIIENALLIWEPRITNININIQSVPEFQRIIVSIGFTIRQSQVQDNITFKIK
jgi:phage baseplate assembly protein W